MYLNIHIGLKSITVSPDATSHYSIVYGHCPSVELGQLLTLMVRVVGFEPTVYHYDVIDFKSIAFQPVSPHPHYFYLSLIFLKNLQNNYDQLFVLLCVNYNSYLLAGQVTL